MRRFVRNTMKVAMRKASLVLIGDFVMEPAQPIRRAPGWEKSALGKFYTRYGQHFHSIAWYVDDLNETCARLSERKIRLFDMVGNAVTQPSRGDGAVWTHPVPASAVTCVSNTRRDGRSTNGCRKTSRPSSDIRLTGMRWPRSRSPVAASTASAKRVATK